MTADSPNEFRPLRDVVLAHPRTTFRGADRIAREWRDLNFTAPPDYDEAVREYDAFAAILASAGATISWLPEAVDVGLDGLYTRDASVVTPGGIVLCRMGKPQRRGEPAAHEQAFRARGVPVVGRIAPPGCLEGGDVVWLGPRTVAVGRGYRTNDEGIAQLAALIGHTADVITVPLPHWRGSDDVFHLMSVISPVDADLAVVYAPLLPVPFRERLLALGYTLVDVSADEFETMGTNVLALAPRRVLMVDGNPDTRRRLERAGVDVVVYSGREISVKGGGGPTCLTRPVTRIENWKSANFKSSMLGFAPIPFIKGAARW